MGKKHHYAKQYHASERMLYKMFLRFPDAAQEHEFRSQSLANRLMQIRLNIIVGVALILSFVYFDHQFVAEGALHWPITIRSYVMTPLAVSTLIMSLYGTPLNDWNRYAGIPLAVIGLCFSLMIAFTKTPISIYYLTMGIVQFQIFAFFMLGLTLPAGLFVSVLGGVSYSVTAWMQAPETVPFVAANLIATSIVLSLAKWHNEFHERQLFIANKRILASEKQRAAADNERISWLENLARFLKHEIKNALMGAKTSLLLLQRRYEIDNSDKYLTRASASLDTMKWHIDKVSDITSFEKGILTDEGRPLSLDMLIEEHCEHYKVIYPNQEFITLTNSGQRFVKADPERIRQLLDKLISNAIDHRFENTPIVIRTEVIDCTYIHITVKNIGPPLPEDKDKLFSLFFSSRTLDKRDGNLGLGLYIVKLIAERHQGYVAAETIGAEDAVEFTVAFPIAENITLSGV